MNHLKGKGLAFPSSMHTNIYIYICMYTHFTLCLKSADKTPAVDDLSIFIIIIYCKKDSEMAAIAFDTLT